MLRTIKQSDHNIKYNNAKNRITFKALIEGASAEMSDTKGADTTHQSFKSVEIGKGALDDVKDNEKLCVMLDNDTEGNVLASTSRGNLIVLNNKGVLGIAITVDERPILKDFVKLVQQNKIKSVQVYSDALTIHNNHIEKVNNIRAISINTK
ncbi:hypothetical protein [Staphylococcus nepalensis]|uniref:hypothetical protein n=1 Tax=Staphylococcus nepalensis TaxID=214473 RepID=UPI001A98E154|nr:hypothetical protein [Staphylococcus nepalensis]MBO1220476.1 hypothetical protein [Staphylococcus nepalensis]